MCRVAMDAIQLFKHLGRLNDIEVVSARFPERFLTRSSGPIARRSCSQASISSPHVAQHVLAPSSVPHPGLRHGVGHPCMYPPESGHPPGAGHPCVCSEVTNWFPPRRLIPLAYFRFRLREGTLSCYRERGFDAVGGRILATGSCDDTAAQDAQCCEGGKRYGPRAL